MKVATQTRPAAEFFGNAPKDYTGLCQVYLPRPLHSAADHIRTLARHFNVEPGVLR